MRKHSVNCIEILGSQAIRIDVIHRIAVPVEVLVQTLRIKDVSGERIQPVEAAGG